jgi:hypothetical protein
MFGFLQREQVFIDVYLVVDITTRNQAKKSVIVSQVPSFAQPSQLALVLCEPLISLYLGKLSLYQSAIFNTFSSVPNTLKVFPNSAQNSLSKLGIISIARRSDCSIGTQPVLSCT